MKRRFITIEISCCGDCPYYAWKKHCCSKGAVKEDDPRSPFYDDCPLKFEDKEIDRSEQDEHNG